MKIKEVESKWKLLHSGSETFCKTALPSSKQCSWSPASTDPGHHCQPRSMHPGQLWALSSPSVVGTAGRVLGNMLGRPGGKGVQVLLRIV